MKCKIIYRLFLFGTILLTIGCSDSESDDSDNVSGVGQIKTLADLKALFDKGEITHVDYVTEENRVILDEEIESMTMVPDDDIFGFALMDMVTKSPPPFASTPDNLRIRHTTSLTFADEIVNSDLPTTHWAETITKMDGVEVENFAPYAYLVDSEINTASLSLLDDRLQMKFKKK